MNIPDEVVERAEHLRESRRDDEANQVIAGWAQKEALREAADEVTNLIQGPPLDEYDRAIADAVHHIEQKRQAAA